MSKVMTRLREEHRSIAKILRALEHQLANFDATEQPDYDVLAAIAGYFLSFPDRCHHPKEDLVYRKMCERDLCVANSYSRGDREFEKATAMLFPSEIAQRGRMRDHTAAPFRRRVTV